MFYGCHSLISLPKFNFGNDIILDYMFNDCYSLISLPNFKIDTTQTEQTIYMFIGCHSCLNIPPQFSL